MRRALTNLMLTLVFLAGLGIALYPTISNQFNLYRASLLMNDYDAVAQQLSPEDYSDLIAACDAYNADLVGGVVPDVFSIHSDEASPEYMALLNLNGDGVMGEIEIPGIGVKIPIYHTTFDDVLQNGAGHMEGSSLPVGGENTHCVLAAHRGLPSAKLFTDLDLMEVGDLMYLRVLNEILAYRVEEILIVEPQETESLAIVEGGDHLTLVTCTPYGINSHRLLVRGARVLPEDEESVIALTNDAVEWAYWKCWLLFAAPVFLTGMIVCAPFMRRRRPAARGRRMT